MQLLAFIILYPLLWCISILPFRILYFLSDILYVFTYYIIGYRKKTVRENIQLAFPLLSDKERYSIEKKSYHHLCDNLLEMVKTLTISQKEIDKRFVFSNIEVMHEMESRGKSIAVFCVHYASYEWLLVMNVHLHNKGYGIYKKIRNKYFDQLVRDIRSKFHATLIDTKESVKAIIENKRKGILGSYGFVADQSPKLDKALYWHTFMGIEVPVHVGAEVLAKRMDMNVMYAKVEIVKRGYYKTTFVPMVDHPRDYPNYEITDKYLALVEEQIYAAPEYYLWTHKRWKHRGKKPIAKQEIENQKSSIKNQMS